VLVYYIIFCILSLLCLFCVKLFCSELYSETILVCVLFSERKTNFHPSVLKCGFVHALFQDEIW
jgi:hypothetical protein